MKKIHCICNAIVFQIKKIENHCHLSCKTMQVVANCLFALQEIWGVEASSSEEAAREREALISKPIIYYLLNRYAVSFIYFSGNFI